MISKNLPIFIAVFLFPILIVTVKHGGGAVYILLLLFGLFLGWSAWQTLESWEKRVLIGFSIFIVLISISLINTQDVYPGIKRMEKYSLFPLFIPMYLLLKKYQVETGKVYLFGVFVSAFAMFGQAYYQTFVLGWDRAVGAYNSLILGDVSMLVAVIMICALFTVSKNCYHYFLGIPAISIALSASIMSGTRGAWILLPVIVVWLLWEKRKSLRPVHLISIVIIFSLSVLASYSIPPVKNRVDSAINQYQEYTQSATKVSSIQVRFELWRDSITIWKEHPVIGTGVGDYDFDRLQLFNDGKSNLEWMSGHAHNIYFDALAISGLVGLFALLIFVLLIPFLTFRSFWKKEHDPWIRFYALSGMATIIAFAVFGLTESWFSRNSFVRTYLMSILVFMSSIAIRKKLAVDSMQLAEKDKDSIT